MAWTASRNASSVDPTIDMECEKIVKGMEKTFDYNKFPFVVVLETNPKG